MKNSKAFQILDQLFFFVSADFRAQFKDQGLYQLIIDGSIKDSAAFYDYVPEKLLSFQDTDYSDLARDLLPVLAPGSVLQIGCGLGGLLQHLAAGGVQPIFGIDACEGMIRLAKTRLQDFEQIQLFVGKAQDFDYGCLGSIDNVILNNFWGILPEDQSVQLLIELKKHLSPGAKIIIGDLSEIPFPDTAIAAAKLVEENFGFRLHYPMFRHFFLLGFESAQIAVGGGEFEVLYLE